MNLRKVIKVPKNGFPFLRLDYYVGWLKEMQEQEEDRENL